MSNRRTLSVNRCGHVGPSIKGLCGPCYKAVLYRMGKGETHALPILHPGPIHHGEVFTYIGMGLKGPQRWYVWDHSVEVITLRSDFKLEDDIRYRDVDEPTLRTQYQLIEANPKGTLARPELPKEARC